MKYLMTFVAAFSLIQAICTTEPMCYFWLAIMFSTMGVAWTYICKE